MAEMADAKGDAALAAAARAAAEKCRQAVEKTYWLKDARLLRVRHRAGEAGEGVQRGAGAAARRAPGPHRRAARHGRWSTRTPCCPRCRCGGGRSTRSARSPQIDHLASAALATDWGHRLLSDRSELYDPLSYHYGSVWGLFTGWASMGAYRYGRPHAGYQALMANVLLTYQYALGLRDRAAVRRLQRALRPLVAPPGLVGGDGGDAAGARAARHRGHGRRADAHVRAAAPRGLGPRVRDQRPRGRGALRPRPRARAPGG